MKGGELMPKKPGETLISVWVADEFNERLNSYIKVENERLKPVGKSINRKKLVIEALNQYLEKKGV